ncbi:uncharacterized protein LOC128350700 isoform X2 [Hemicordylus capensis]|uniref:uncharacterized protein LOC128350700 isoform X2 n=1 Tax=Hemicordylus capensis TaxID=884348 RepID=UPI002303EF7B|nr:uncharacterized protein LOC128350700 isoform X2 [Hemicordylus capensis]
MMRRHRCTFKALLQGTEFFAKERYPLLARLSRSGSCPTKGKGEGSRVHGAEDSHRDMETSQPYFHGCSGVIYELMRECKAVATGGERKLKLRPTTSLVLESNATHPQNLTLLLCNSRLVQNKSEVVHDLIMDEGADLLCIMETWLGEASGLVWSQLLPEGYSVVGQVRGCGRGGRVAVVYKNTIFLTRIPVRDLAILNVCN